MAHANTEELIDAWQEMDDRDLMILRKMAASLIDGTEFSEPLDLMHEALGRCLDGRRTWPTHVKFSVFLGNVMRSIASSERSGRRKQGRVRVDFDEFMAEMEQFATAPSAEQQALVFEEARLTQKMADDLRRKLDGDEAAQKVLSGMIAGLSPKEMRESFHMDVKAFEAARMRIIRRLKQANLH